MAFGDHVGFDFEGAQGGGGIGGKIRIGGAGGEDDDAAFFQVPDGAAADIRLGHLVHLDGAHDAGGNADLFQGVGKGQGIDHRGEHAHVVGRSRGPFSGRRQPHRGRCCRRRPLRRSGRPRGHIGHFLASAFTRSAPMPKRLRRPGPRRSVSIGCVCSRAYLRPVTWRGDCRLPVSIAASPTLKRTKRATAMFSPSLAILVFTSCSTVRWLPSRRLLEQADLLIELVQAAFDDLVDHLLGLAFVQGAGAGISFSFSSTSAARLPCGCNADRRPRCASRYRAPVP